MSAQAQKPNGPPYAPQVWVLGGTPSVSVDVPITAILLAFYIGGAVTHMTIFQRNRKRGHFFIFNGLLFGFSMARIVTCILRIASTSLPHNIQLAIAAQIFVAAGVVLIFVINLFFTQRIIRAQHPNLGWHKLTSAFFIATYVLIGLTLAMLITTVVQTYYTRNTEIRKIDRSIQLYGLTYFAVVSFLPAVLLALSLAIPRTSPIDKFGSPAGRMRHNIAIVLTGSLVLCFGASYRAGTAYLHPVPRSQPLPAYFSRALFYIVNFVIEILVLYFYALVRVDKRFHIPNGAKGPGSYSRQRKEEAATSAPEPAVTSTASSPTAATEHSTDELTIDGMSPDFVKDEFELETHRGAEHQV